MATQTILLSILLVTIPDWGHLSPFVKLASTLQRSVDNSRGHLRVQLATMDHRRSAVEKQGIEFVSLGRWEEGEEEGHTGNTMKVFGESSGLLQRLRSGASTLMENYGLKMGSGLIEHLAKANATGSMPTVIVTDGLTSAGFDAADKFQLPLIVVCPYYMTVALQLAGFERHNDPPHVPVEFQSLTTPKHAHPFLRHWVNPWLKKGINFMVRQALLPSRNKVRQQLGLGPLEPPVVRNPDGSSTGVWSPTLGALSVQASVPRVLYLAGITWELNVERGLPEAWHLVGPLVVDPTHDFPPNFGPEDAAVQEFLDAAQAAGEPVLFAAAGTMTSLSQAQVTALAEAFTALSSGSSGSSPRVLWALKPDSQKLLPPHLQSCSSQDLLNANSTAAAGKSSSTRSSSSDGRLLVVPWVKQTAVLAHPQTKVFLTHGGLGSVHEALALGQAVPLVVPFSNGADHVVMGQQVSCRGLGTMLKAREILQPGKLAGTVHELLGNSRYSERVAEVAAAWREAEYGPKRAADMIIEFATSLQA